jgi:D-amino-acid oxidase
MDNGQEFTSVCINTAVYLPWLVGQCVKNGAVFKRAVFKHIADAANAHHSGQKADVVINCTGLSSKTLGGVLDDKMYPARGQIVVVRNDPGPMMSTSGTDDGEAEALYIMTRAAGKILNAAFTIRSLAYFFQVVARSSVALIKSTTGIHCQI